MVTAMKISLYKGLYQGLKAYVEIHLFACGCTLIFRGLSIPATGNENPQHKKTLDPEKPNKTMHERLHSLSPTYTK